MRYYMRKGDHNLIQKENMDNKKKKQSKIRKSKDKNVRRWKYNAT